MWFDLIDVELDCVYLLVISDVHHLPPDPTLTVENMTRVMAKVKPKERKEVYSELVHASILENIQKQYSKREVAYVDAYVNCCSWSSWQELVKVLYQHHHVDAVEDVKSYLPPRGESPCTCTC